MLCGVFFKIFYFIIYLCACVSICMYTHAHMCMYMLKDQKRASDSLGLELKTVVSYDRHWNEAPPLKEQQVLLTMSLFPTLVLEVFLHANVTYVGNNLFIHINRTKTRV